MDPGVIINRDMVHILDRHRSLTADEITCLAAMDREGKKRNLPLMTVSVAILELTAGDKKGLPVEDRADKPADLKKGQKSHTGIASASLFNRKK